MFNECEVLLTQGSSREPDKTRWLHVTLLTPKMPAMAGQNVISYFDEVSTQGLVYWGKSRLGPTA